MCPTVMTMPHAARASTRMMLGTIQAVLLLNPCATYHKRQAKKVCTTTAVDPETEGSCFSCLLVQTRRQLSARLERERGNLPGDQRQLLRLAKVLHRPQVGPTAVASGLHDNQGGQHEHEKLSGRYLGARELF